MSPPLKAIACRSRLPSIHVAINHMHALTVTTSATEPTRSTKRKEEEWEPGGGVRGSCYLSFE